MCLYFIVKYKMSTSIGILHKIIEVENHTVHIQMVQICHWNKERLYP